MNTVEEVLTRIREIIASASNIDEYTLYEALVAEAEGWEMRLEEIELEADEEDYEEDEDWEDEKEDD